MSEIISLFQEDKHSPERSPSRLGQTGEELALRFLAARGFRPVAANFKVPVGRNRVGAQVTGEIDLIAIEKDVLCFIEVKTRSSDAFASPQSAVDLRKQRQITRTARVYKKIFSLQQMRCRYDVVSIVIPPGMRPKILLFRGFWTDDKFRKRKWADEF